MPDPAIGMIARAATGSFRDALGTPSNTSPTAARTWSSTTCSRSSAWPTPARARRRRRARGSRPKAAPRLRPDVVRLRAGTSPSSCETSPPTCATCWWSSPERVRPGCGRPPGPRDRAGRPDRPGRDRAGDRVPWRCRRRSRGSTRASSSSLRCSSPPQPQADLSTSGARSRPDRAARAEARWRRRGVPRRNSRRRRGTPAPRGGGAPSARAAAAPSRWPSQGNEPGGGGCARARPRARADLAGGAGGRRPRAQRDAGRAAGAGPAGRDRGDLLGVAFAEDATFGKRRRRQTASWWSKP